MSTSPTKARDKKGTSATKSSGIGSNKKVSATTVAAKLGTKNSNSASKSS